MKNWLKANDDEIVCYCLQVNKKTIVEAIKDGNQTIKQLQQTTKACTGTQCKKLNPSGKCCSNDLLELIKIYGNNNDKDSNNCSCCCG